MDLVETIRGRTVRTWDEMPVDVARDLDRRVAELFLDVLQGPSSPASHVLG
jgi:hypothetical protein